MVNDHVHQERMFSRSLTAIAIRESGVILLDGRIGVVENVTFALDLVNRVFPGSREALLVQLLGKRKTLTAAEKAFLQQLLEEQE